MKTVAQYIDEAKLALGNPRMSDRELGERLGGPNGAGYLQTNIHRAKRGVCPDTIAIALAKAIGVHPGEVLIAARAERETNAETKQYLLEWARKVSAFAPKIAVAPEVVIRGGVKVVPFSEDQVWRKRSPPHAKQRPAPAGLLIPAGTSRARAPASPSRAQAATTRV